MSQDTALRDGLEIWRSDPNTRDFRSSILREIADLEKAIYASRPGAMKEHADLAYLIGQVTALKKIENRLRVGKYG